VIALDYGNPSKRYPAPGSIDESFKRWFLHSRVALREYFGKEEIDAVLITHHHDDHIGGLQILHRLYNARLLCGEGYADILKTPGRYDQQCLLPCPLPVEGVTEGKWYELDGLRYCFEPVTGHTKYGALVLMEYQGQRLIHIGDAFFFLGGKGFNYTPEATFFPNHVYRNGAELNSYRRIAKLVRDFRPEWIFSGHADPYRPDELFYQKLSKGADEFELVHRELVVLDGESIWEVGVSHSAAELFPYRQVCAAGETVRCTARVRNPLLKEVRIRARLVGFESLAGDWVEMVVPASGVGELDLGVQTESTSPNGQRVFALEVEFDGQSMGEVQECLVQFIAK
jgi:glyoxylase-like metal-dependent hydrolase (beta-lactamase superfamily II)